MSKRPCARLRKIGSKGVLTNLDVELELLGDLVHDVDVESLVVRGAAELERRIRDVRADRERALGDRLELARRAALLSSSPPHPTARQSAATTATNVTSGQRSELAHRWLPFLQAKLARLRSRPGQSRTYLDSAESTPGVHVDSPLDAARPGRRPLISTRCAPTPNATRAASMFPVTRAARAPTRACSRRVGEQALALDIPALTYGIDAGPAPTPFQLAQQMAAEAWGARRTLVPDQRRHPGQPRRLPGARAARGPGRRPAQRPFEHHRRADPVGAEADVRRSGARPGALDRPLPRARGARAGARPDAGCGRRDRRVTDLLRRGRRRARLAGWPTATACRWWSTRRGARTCISTSRCPRTRSSAGADLVISSTHKLVGSLTQSAMLHLGRGARRAASTSTSWIAPSRWSSPPAPARCSRARSTPPAATPASDGHDAARRRRSPRWRRCAQRFASSRASTFSTSGWSGGRACMTTIRCGSRSTCAAPAHSGFEIARMHARAGRHQLGARRPRTSSWRSSAWGSRRPSMAAPGRGALRTRSSG